MTDFQGRINMFFRRKPENKRRQHTKESIDVISVTIEDVQEAVNNFAKELNEEISLRSIILDNHEIDFDLLHKYLGGKPDRPFYMSKETFEIFEDPEFPKYIDHCQVACDHYFMETGEEPIVPGDKTNKISYFKLKNYLIEHPPIDLYLDVRDRMVTHRKPI
jgi:hypothetical protein